MLTLTIVIPVYNEERHIKACLDAISKQTVMPDEVLVIDNNCTDSTVKIAKKFKFVKVIKEPKQGYIPARNKGYNSAKSKIIGRLDADSIINSTWSEEVLKKFNSDKELHGLTGVAKLEFIPYIQSIKNSLWSRGYYQFTHSAYRTTIMWGGNMAIRKTAWDLIRSEASTNPEEVHEDQDVSILMAAKGLRIQKSDKMIAEIDDTTYRYLPKALDYIKRFYRTKKLHTKNGNLKSKKIHKIKKRSYVLSHIVNVAGWVLWFGVMLLLFPIDYWYLRATNQKP